MMEDAYSFARDLLSKSVTFEPDPIPHAVASADIATRLIEADRAAVALAAKRELLEEIAAAAEAHGSKDLPHVSWAVDRALLKYSQPPQKSQEGGG